jgi:hypothetical protein
MRTGALLVVAASVLAPSSAYAGKCPADPFKASQVVWNWGILKPGEQATGVHPCGRKITCIGGRFDPVVKRSCHWD